MFWIKIRRPPRSTHTYTRVPYTPLFRAHRQRGRRAVRRTGRGPAAARWFVRRSARGRGPAGSGAGQPAARQQSAPVPTPGDSPPPATAPTKCRWRARCRSTRRHSCQGRRSEEHTSELQSLMRISYAVFCLKKKKKKKTSKVIQCIDTHKAMLHEDTHITLNYSNRL